MPRTIEAATALLERHAALDAELAGVEGDRAASLATTNAISDMRALPLIDEMAAIKAAIAPWWVRNSAALTGGKRKSIELGGCGIGTRSGRPKLGIASDEDVLVTEMKRLRWAREYLRTVTSIDKAAVSKGFGGRHVDGLKAIGFSIVPGTDTFYIERITAGAADTIAHG